MPRKDTPRLKAFSTKHTLVSGRAEMDAQHGGWVASGLDSVSIAQRPVEGRRRGGAQPREAAGGAFTVGQHVEYQSKSKQTLVRSTVVKVHRDGALDLNREDMLHTRADPSLVQQFSRGEGGLGAVPAMASTLPSEGVLLGRT